MALPRQKEFWAGILFVFIGGLALYFGHDLNFGTARTMGPGFFPKLVAISLVLMGCYQIAHGAIGSEEAVSLGPPRIYLTLLSIFIFALLLPKAGLFCAIAALTVIASLAGNTFKAVEVAALAAFLGLFTWAIFVYGLSLPIPLWPV